MSANFVDIDIVLNDFCNEMETGLSEGGSSLAMIASYIKADACIPVNKPVIVLDAGGTNLRVCTVSFNEHGTVDIECFEQYQMPGVSHELSKQSFYNAICDYLEPVINKSDSIGFCFSYPTEMAESKDGKLLYWTKEVKVPELVGEYIGSGLLAELAKRGHTGKKLVLLNDTVSTLLAGRAIGKQWQCDSYIGFILGTGTNTAYIEKNSNIPKVSASSGTQVINVESGNFSKYPQGDIDKLFDDSTTNPGAYTFEKMISGRYLGSVALCLLKKAAVNGLFSKAATAEIKSLRCLTTPELSIFFENSFGLFTPFNSEKITPNDRKTLYYFILELIERAAKLTAVNIAAAVIKSNSGRSPLHPICINIDGSMFYELFGFNEKCEEYLAATLNSRGFYFKTIRVENAPIIGAAFAGLAS